MKIISLNVGAPRIVRQGDRDVLTGIFKAPVAGPIMLRRLNLDGDRQADLQVHGGRNKAVYAYPSEHYDFWRAQLPEMDLPWGMFGENLTTEGLSEEHAYIGDEFRIGQVARVKVTQPRLPCYKLGIRFGREDIIKRFVASRRSGIYFSVLEEGLVSTGDPIERVREDERRLSIADVNRAYVLTRENIPLVRRIVSLEILPRGLHDDFAEQLSLLDQ
jgi:MOSC domain-containing protein YiiM